MVSARPRAAFAHAVAVVALLEGTLAALPAGADDIFRDTFESGSDCAWSGGSPPVASAPLIALGHTLGDTSGGSTEIAGSCVGAAGRERVYAVVSPAAGVLAVALDAASDLGAYLRSDGFSPASELDCADDDTGGITEHLSSQVTAGDLVFVVVDGASAVDSGPFDLFLSHSCGDFLVGPGEQCDGLDLGGHTCQEFGFSGGSLACDPTCTLNFSACIPFR